MNEGFHVSAWSIRRPVPVVVLFIVLMFSGMLSFTRLGIDDTPNIDVPAVSITVVQPGAGPSELESQVTRKIEDAVAGLGRIDQLQSTVTDGRSLTIINFELGTNSDRATNEVRNAVAQVRMDLPQGIQEPVVERLNFSDGAVAIYSVVSDRRSPTELSNWVDRTIAREVLSVRGAGRVERLGGVDRAIRIDLDPARLDAYGLTASEVNDRVRALNIDLPGGRADLGDREQNIRTLGSAKTVSELRAYRLPLPDGSTVALGDLGIVEDAYSEPRQVAFFDDQAVVGFSVLRSTGSNLVQVEEGTDHALARLRETLPEDIKIEKIFTLADSVRGSYRSTFEALIAGSILTVFVVGAFLRDWRPTLITALALPLSIVPTFVLMETLGYTLNGMTMLALTLAIGNLVDDAICMIENIDRHRNMGKAPFRAALDAAREIGLAVVATTATIVAVFLPVAFMGGIPGQFFQPFGVTFAASTMVSTLVAVTMTPMLAARLLRRSERPVLADMAIEAGDTRSQFERETALTGSPNGPYRRVLRWALRHRLIVVVTAVVVFIASLQLVPLLPKGLFSSGDRGTAIVNVELPPGSTLAETVQVSQQVAIAARSQPGLRNTFIHVSDPITAKVYINLVPKGERDYTLAEFEETLRDRFSAIPGARVAFQSSGAGGSSKDVTLVLKGENPQLLKETADAIERGMGGISGLVDIASSASLVQPELAIIPDLQRAADLGVSVQAIARTASLATIGEIEANQAKFNLPDRQIPIEVKLAPAARRNIATLENLKVPGRNNTLVPLSAVASIRLVSGPARVDRFDRARQITLEANLAGIALGEALDQIRALPEMNPLPAGIVEEPAGDAEIMRDIFSRFLAALSLAILSIFSILVLLYNNFLYPLSILAALPFSIGGALLGLLVAQKELGLFALIGIVLLMGLVTKNAILLVDFALEGQRHGMSQRNAIVEAGASRLRPILMTSLSTIAGMLPIALELGEGAEERSPMGIAVIGGFLTATVLTLVVVPVLFSYVDNFNHWLMRSLRPEMDEVPSGFAAQLPQGDRDRVEV